MVVITDVLQICKFICINKSFFEDEVFKNLLLLKFKILSILKFESFNYFLGFLVYVSLFLMLTSLLVHNLKFHENVIY